MLIGDSDELDAMQPLTVDLDTWSDVRMRSFHRDPAAIGDPGGFWMIYFPNSARSASPNLSPVRPIRSADVLQLG